MAKLEKIPKINSGNTNFQYGFEPWIKGNPTTPSRPITNVTKQDIVAVKFQGSPITNTATGSKNKITDATPKAERINDIEILKKDLKSLQGAFYKNNTPSNQDFVKSSRFTNRVRLPIYATAPTTCAIGEVYVNSGTGKLYVCSSANTWSLVGTQS